MRFVAVALFFVAARNVSGQQQPIGPQRQSTLVFADSMSFWIDAPKGWVADMDAGKRDGAIAVLYPQGESWSSATAVIAATVVVPKGGRIAVIPAAVRNDSAQWSFDAPDLAYAVRDSVRTASGVFAQIRVYRSASTSYYDTVAYIQGDGRVWVLTLNARSAVAHDAALADFTALVKSYAPGPVRQAPPP